MCWHFANARYFRIIQMIFFYRQCMANVFITCVILALFTGSWTVNLVIYCPKAVTLIQLFITIDEWRQPECIRVFQAGRVWYLKRGVWLYTVCHLPLPFAICDSESVTAVNYSRLLPLSGAQEMSKNNPMINRKSLSSRRVGWGSVSDSDSDLDWDPRGPVLISPLDSPQL